MSTRYTSTPVLADYPAPSLQEMAALCLRLGLVKHYEVTGYGLLIETGYRILEVTAKEAGILMLGLLQGFYHKHRQDDLRLADWVT